MNFTCARAGLLLVLILPLVSCKTERTILAGPTVTGLDGPGQGGDSRFKSQDPSGYLQNGTEGGIRGLNAMSSKMFGGKLNSQTEKEFKANKNFLTREFAGKKDFASKTWKGGPKGRTWTDKLFDTSDSSETGMEFSDAGKNAAVKDSPDADKIARTGDYHDAGLTARTSNYRPAEKALSDGRDAPKLTGVKPSSLDDNERRVRDRIANSTATATEINQFLGKP